MKKDKLRERVLVELEKLISQVVRTQQVLKNMKICMCTL